MSPTKKAIPGPINYNAAIGLTWRHWYAIRRNPLKFFSNLGHTYGDISFFRLFRYRCYLLNHPDLIHQMLVVHAKRFRKQPREMQAFARVTGDGLLVSDGELWQERRRIVQPAFGANALERAAQIIAEVTEEVTAEWQCGDTVEIVDAMSHIMVAATMRTMFGGSCDGDVRQLALDTRVISRDVMRDASALWRFPISWGRSGRVAIDAALASTRAVLRDVVEQRLHWESDSDGDLLAQLLMAVRQGKMTTEQAVNESLTMLFAGNHTASAGLSWLWFEMARHPQHQQSVRREGIKVLANRRPTAEDLPQLGIAQQVVSESLRLNPPAWGLFVRQAAEDVDLGGYAIPKGSWLFAQPYVTHRDSRFFPKPLKFDPDRFQEGALTPLQQRAYFPFGMGPHTCVGRHLALLQMTLVLVALCRRWHFQLAEPNRIPVAVAQTAIWPRDGIHLKIKRVG